MACASPAARVNERGFGVDVALVNLVAAHGPHEPHVRAGLRSLGSSPGDDGRVRGAFTARNTVSGRYTAGAWHSLPRTSLSEEAVEEILAANALPEGLAAEELLRPCVVPRAGYVFVQADWKQAQARIVAAELGEAWPEGDPYVAAAARLGLEGRGARAFGKLLQLSLQFGMGAAELANKAAEMGVDWEAIGLTPAEAIAAHRRERPDLVRLWKALPARTIADGRARRLSLWSGRELVYPNAIANGDGVVYTGRHGQREQAWGGALLAHFAQGVEVDLLDDAIERLEAAGLPVVFHMHDGLVVEVPEHAGPHALSTVEEVMTSPPDWATDRRLRLNVAAQLRTRFGSV